MRRAGELLEQSVKEARRLAATARRKARGRGAQAKLRAARALDELADLCAKVAKQISQRVRGEKITDRSISLADPDARPIRKGKLGKPTEFGYVAQIAEITPNTKTGARGLIVPAASFPGNPGENTLLPQMIAELDRLGLTPNEIALDGGFTLTATNDDVNDLAPQRVFIPGRQLPGSRRTQRRCAPHRRRRTHQPPQRRLRPAAQPTEGPASAIPRPGTGTSCSSCGRGRSPGSNRRRCMGR